MFAGIVLVGLGLFDVVVALRGLAEGQISALALPTAADKPACGAFGD